MARIPDSNFGKKNVRKPKLEQMETLSFCSVCNPFPQILLLKFQKRGYKLEQMLSFQKQKCRSVSKAMLTLEKWEIYPKFCGLFTLVRKSGVFNSPKKTNDF